MDTKTSQIGFRCEQDLKLLLEKIGEQERRSLSQVVVLFLEQSIKNYVKSHPELLPLLPEYLND